MRGERRLNDDDGCETFVFSPPSFHSPIPLFQTPSPHDTGSLKVLLFGPSVNGSSFAPSIYPCRLTSLSTQGSEELMAEKERPRNI